MYRKDVNLGAAPSNTNDVFLGQERRSGPADVYLYGTVSGNDVFHYRQRYDFPQPTGTVFPTQYAGLRYFHGTVKELCLVAPADAPVSVWRINKNGTVYAVYLVDTSDPNASPVRINTAAGIKAARLKT